MLTVFVLEKDAVKNNLQVRKSPVYFCQSLENHVPAGTK